MTVRLVQARGEFYWHGARVFLGEALCHEPIGLEPIDGRFLKIHFAHVLLAVFDDWCRVRWAPQAQAGAVGWVPLRWVGTTVPIPARMVTPTIGP